MKQNKLRTLYEKDMTKKILASLLSILIGLVVGSVIIAAVGFSNRSRSSAAQMPRNSKSRNRRLRRRTI